MSPVVVFARVSDAPLDVVEHEAAVADASAGATVLFVGTVRDHDPDASGTVARLDYSAHPDAQAALRRIAAEVGGQGTAGQSAVEQSAAVARPDAGGRGRVEIRIAVSHRIGSLRVGEPALIAAVSSAHRAEAFAACHELVERIKTEVPIWKKQFGADGSASWIGLG